MMKYLRNEPLKKHTTFKIGGTADYFCAPSSAEEISEALDFAREHDLDVSVMGAGSNLLVLDRGVRGLVMKVSGGGKPSITGQQVRVGAGMMLPRIMTFLAQNGLGGLEFLAGVPGTVGGAIVMNAGAWGKEVAKRVKEVVVVDRSGKKKILTKKELGFRYRRSRLQNGKWIVAEVVFSLTRRDKKKIREEMHDYLTRRKLAQPLGIPNCGSVFKNPTGKYAGQLIEAAGCKGIRYGDAQVSEKHANFIVNLGDAKARDVIRLITAVQKAVEGCFHIVLEPELKIMVKSPL
jgi:UDP-N-acetylmuramate dehydrogenase